MQSTQALVFADVGVVRLQSIDMPDPGPGEVQVRTRYSTISAGTEGWMLQGKFYWGTTPFPYVPSYQRMGTIVAVGPDIEDWHPGDEVVVTASSRWSGEVHSFSGAHIRLANAPVSEVHALPEGVDETNTSAVVVAQVGYNAASRVDMGPGDHVLVYGDGMIGQAVRARWGHAILVGHRPERLQLARQYSADR